MASYLSMEQLAVYAERAGFTGEALRNIVAIAWAESSGQVDAVGDNGQSFGLVQINAPSHPDVDKNRLITDPLYAFQQAYRISGGGKNFNPWTTWSHATSYGAQANAQQYLTEAGRVVEGVQAAQSQGADIGLTPSTRAGGTTQAHVTSPTGVTERMTTPATGAPTTSYTGPPITAQSTPAQIEAYIRANYPSVAPFLANPEIRAVLFDGAIHSKSADEIAYALQGTQYWKTHDAASQHYDYFLGTASPATVATVTDKAKSVMSDLFANEGIQATDAQITTAAAKALRSGWIDTNGSVADAESLQKFGAFAVGLSGGPKPGSKIGVSVDQLRQISKAYMVPMTDADLNTYAMNIETGRGTLEQFQSEMAAHAKTLFQNDPDIVRAIDSGRSPSDYFAPIKNKIAETLELTPDQVDLSSPQYASVMQMYDPNTKARRAMTLGEAQQFARDQPGYKNTRAYHAQDAQFGMQLAQTFGAIQ